MRDYRIDLLRFIGLSMIMLAHVDPPNIIFQLRNFDVPLMVLISGMSFGLTYKNERYLEYVWRRVKRLVLPVWIFLAAYFFALFVFKPQASDLETSIIFSSFLFMKGFGYVWIIRVFLLVALVAPFIYKVNKEVKSDGIYFLSLLMIMVAYEVCLFLSASAIVSGLGEYFSLVVYYLIPYSILFAFGLRLLTISLATQIRFIIFSALIFTGLVCFLWVKTGHFVVTQEYKYPPSLYYLSYALTISMVLWVTSSKILKGLEKCIYLKSVILFIASNSIWIYLWHIPLIKIININFAIKYTIVFFIAVLITYIQVLIVTKLIIPKITKVKFKKNIKILFTG